jgi:hypothetical protein
LEADEQKTEQVRGMEELVVTRIEDEPETLVVQEQTGEVA